MQRVAGPFSQLRSLWSRIPLVSKPATPPRTAQRSSPRAMSGTHTYQCAGSSEMRIHVIRQCAPVCPRTPPQTHRVRLCRYPRPGLTVDAVMVTGEERPQVLLIRRKNDPFAGSWALPGGFVDEGEELGAAAARELEEETGLSAREAGLTQVGAFGEPGRDPRGWCVSVAYAALLPAQAEVLGADDAEEAQWWPVAEVPGRLAFDHKLILRCAFQHLARQDATPAALAAGLRDAAAHLEGPWRQEPR
ncbi:hypothetical protein ACKKBG_A32115 [Auxenochlorella protothecoides x Auxenochlorella symbiontica]